MSQSYYNNSDYGFDVENSSDIELDFDSYTDIDFYKDVDIDISVDLCVDIDGNFAQVNFAADAWGEDTLVEVDVAVFAADDMSSATGSIVAAVG